MSLLEKWFLSAEEDYDSAVLLLAAKKYRPAVYHAQQCGEKALKAFIVYKNQPIQKTHNLVVLVRYCMNIEPDFSNIINATFNLNGLDVEYRYPVDDGSGIYDEPTDIQIQESIDNAKGILDFVKSKCI
jgi:HEPN domain-containing protein